MVHGSGMCSPCMRRSRGGTGSGPPTENHKNIGFLSSTVPDPMKNHQAPKPAFNVGPSPACQLPVNAILALDLLSPLIN